jgi:hypothetical protein
VRRETTGQQDERDDDQSDERADEEAEGERQPIFTTAKILDKALEPTVPGRCGQRG